MANSLNIRLINNVTDIAQGDTASTVILELLDENRLIIPTLNGKSALVNFINGKNEIQYQYTTFVFDSRIEFNVDTVIPHGTYNVEVRIQSDGFSYVFPSSVNYTLRINKSANDFYNIAINQNGVDLIVSEVYQRLNSENPGLLEHVNRKDNPHEVTKDQVGLGKVDNVQQASKSEFTDHVEDNNIHVTSDEKEKLAGIEAGAQKNAVTKVNGKTGDVSLSKNDLGLSNVNNVEQASKEELNSHVNDKDNPHEVTKGQVGLGSVQNYGKATKAEAESGSIDTKYMTPLRTKEAIQALGGGGGGDLSPEQSKVLEILTTPTTEVEFEEVQEAAQVSCRISAVDNNSLCVEGILSIDPSKKQGTYGSLFTSLGYALSSDDISFPDLQSLALSDVYADKKFKYGGARGEYIGLLSTDFLVTNIDGDDFSVDTYNLVIQVSKSEPNLDIFSISGTVTTLDGSALPNPMGGENAFVGTPKFPFSIRIPLTDQ